MAASAPEVLRDLSMGRDDGVRGNDACDSRSRDVERPSRLGASAKARASVAGDGDNAAPTPARAAKGRAKRSGQATIAASPAHGANTLAPEECTERPARKQKREHSAASNTEEQTASSSSVAPPVAAVGAEEEHAASLSAPTAATDERSLEHKRLQQSYNELTQQHSQQRQRLHTANEKIKCNRLEMARLLVQVARQEDVSERERVEVAHFQLGRCQQSTVPGHGTVWEGGCEADEISRESERIKQDKANINKLRSSIKQKTKKSSAQKDTGSNAGGASSSTSSAVPWFSSSSLGSSVTEEASPPEEADWEIREMYNYRMFCLGREEGTLKDRDTRLQGDRQLHLKRLQRLEAADRSNFRGCPVVGHHGHHRYQMLKMIGRGGFSEVYRAYDLESNQYCAVKIHELDKEMSEQQKQNFIRRAMREYEIQKKLKHPRVVALLDCFAISEKAFATVLELCEGETLDEYMKRIGPLPEKEARGIVIQMFSGLKYMNSNEHKIIHYDIKPCNIFFTGGEVKIADFGLSKVVHDDSDRCPSIENTSIGAGTYWYLPPECMIGQENSGVKISNKVDVWSTGVVFFEALFRRRPFGHNQSQEMLFRSTIGGGQSFQVEFPSSKEFSREFSKVTVDAKEFIKRLLTVDREARPDVIQAYGDSYLRPPRRTGVPASAVATTSPGTAPAIAGALPPPTSLDAPPA